MTIPEAARCIGISNDSAYAAANRGELPVVRLGRRMLVSTAGLRAMLLLDREPAAS